MIRSYDKPCLTVDQQIALLKSRGLLIADDLTEPCISHIKDVYGVDQVPIWALVEVETFGAVTQLYEKSVAAIQSVIASDYRIGARPL